MHTFVCIYSMKVFSLLTVSRCMQGLKLPPIKSQKQLNGLVFDYNFASPCLSASHKKHDDTESQIASTKHNHSWSSYFISI